MEGGRGGNGENWPIKKKNKNDNKRDMEAVGCGR